MSANDQQTAQNTKDIGDLTRDVKDLTQVVTRVATLVESSEKRYQEERDSTRELFAKMNDLAIKVAASATTDEKLAALLREFLDQKAATEKRITALETKVDTLEKWSDQVTGAGIATGIWIKSLWAIFGVGALALVGYLMKMFFGGSGSDTPTF